MKAAIYHEYGSPDVLSIEDIPIPVPRDNEVLVKVHAASLNSWDWELLRGRPYLARLGGFRKPRHSVLGADIAGRIEAVGGEVTRFKPGDEVFGDLSASGWGGFAEYTCARETALALKPAGVTFDEAASVPQAAVMALQGLRDKRPIQPGDKVLINGAGGGVGTFAVQIARSSGAEVTGVDKAGKLDMLRALGADHVIDYTSEDFTRDGRRYDLIVDVAAHRSIFDYRCALNPDGAYAMIGGSTARILQVMLLGPLLSKIGNKKLSILIHRANKDLAFLGELLETGTIAPVIDRRFSLSETADAFRYYGEGNVRGKIVITMEPDS